VPETKPFTNAASKKIAELDWIDGGSIHRLIPTLRGSGQDFGFGVECQLPGEIYWKWIPLLTGSEEFRKRIEDEIRASMCDNGLDWPTYLRLNWSRNGLNLETNGVNGCTVYVLKSESRYTEHNVDNLRQAMVLQFALSIYTRRMMQFLDFLESQGTEGSVLEDSKPLGEEDTIEVTIRLVSTKKKGRALRRLDV
jgi:hypothetical protein